MIILQILLPPSGLKMLLLMLMMLSINTVAIQVLSRSKRALMDPQVFSFQAVSSDKINQKLRTIDIKKPPGVIISQARSYVLRHNELTTPLTSLMNNCMRGGVFLDNMKLAEVSPSYKKSNNLMKGNYGPVSVLTTLSKLYESTMDDQLLGHFVSILTIF